MHNLWDELQPSPGPPMSISNDDCDKEQHPSWGRCTTNLGRMSLGTNGDALACIEANKKETPAKRNVKRPKRAKKERVPNQTYKWLEKCYALKKVVDKRPGLKKPKVITIWATCILCRYKNLSVWCQDQNNQLPIVDWMCETCSKHALFAHLKGN